MNLDPQVKRVCRAAIFLCLIVPAVSAASGQIAKRAAKPGSSEQTETFIAPQLLHSDNDPTLRYPIAKLSGALLGNVSNGWLDISRRRVHYEVVQPPNKMNDAFDVSASEITDIKYDSFHNLLRIVTPGKKHTFFYLARENWGSVHNASTFWSASGAGAQGTLSIQRALRNFEGVLAEVKVSQAPPQAVAAQPAVNLPPQPEPVAPPAPPTIVLASPSGASPDKTVEVDVSPLVIRGATMDNTGMPVVTINGVPANMRPQNTQAAEFWSDPLPLEPGDNLIQITAANPARVEAKLQFTIHYAPKAAPVNPKALGKAEIIALLQGAVPASRVTDIVKERGVKFTPTADDLNDLRAAGATDELIQAIQQATTPK